MVRGSILVQYPAPGSRFIPSLPLLRLTRKPQTAGAESNGRVIHSATRQIQGARGRCLSGLYLAPAVLRFVYDKVFDFPTQCLGGGDVLAPPRPHAGKLNGPVMYPAWQARSDEGTMCLRHAAQSGGIGKRRRRPAHSIGTAKSRALRKWHI